MCSTSPMGATANATTDVLASRSVSGNNASSKNTQRSPKPWQICTLLPETKISESSPKRPCHKQLAISVYWDAVENYSLPGTDRLADRFARLDHYVGVAPDAADDVTATITHSRPGLSKRSAN